jgi:hypothetical protein
MPSSSMYFEAMPLGPSGNGSMAHAEDARLSHVKIVAAGNTGRGELAHRWIIGCRSRP